MKGIVSSAMPASKRRKRYRNLPYGRRFSRRFCLEDWERSLYLYANPDGCPYDNSDYERALEERELLEYVDSVGPKRANGAWLLKLKTTEAKETVANIGALLVKGLYCAIVDPCQEETCLKVHGVPFHVSNETLRKTFRRFGAVKEVIREACPVKGLEEVEYTTRHISMRLKPTVKKKDVPLWRNIGDVAVQVFVPGRMPVCLTCGGPGHRRLLCPLERSFRGGRKRPYDDNAVSTDEKSGNLDNVSRSDDYVTSQNVETVLENFCHLRISDSGIGATPSQP